MKSDHLMRADRGCCAEKNWIAEFIVKIKTVLVYNFYVRNTNKYHIENTVFPRKYRISAPFGSGFVSGPPDLCKARLQRLEAPRAKPGSGVELVTRSVRVSRKSGCVARP